MTPEEQLAEQMAKMGVQPGAPQVSSQARTYAPQAGAGAPVKVGGGSGGGGGGAVGAMGGPMALVGAVQGVTSAITDSLAVASQIRQQKQAADHQKAMNQMSQQSRERAARYGGARAQAKDNTDDLQGVLSNLMRSQPF